MSGMQESGVKIPIQRRASTKILISTPVFVNELYQILTPIFVNEFNQILTPIFLMNLTKY